MKTQLSLIFLSALVCSPFVTSASIHKSLELGTEIVESFNALFQLAKNVNEFADLIQFKKNEEYVFSKIDSINVQLSKLNDNIHVVDDELRKITRLVENLPHRVRLELRLDKIREKQIYLDKYFNDLVKYCTNFDEYENSTMIDFANRVVSHHTNSVPNLINAVYQRVMGGDVLNLLYDQLQVSNFTREMVDTDNEFKNRNKNLITTMKSYMGKASTELWRCDPDKHVQGETYIELVHFLHAAIINKANINKDRKCRDECDVFKYETPVEKCYHANNWCKEQPPCRKIVNCQYVDSSMSVCSKNMNRDTRRYEYVEFGNGKIFGEKRSCSNQVSHLETYIFWVVWRCSYCFCLCDEYDKPSTERYINLRLVETNTRSNRVVTGLKFIKLNKIIHLQVQEGRLLPYGQIDSNSVRWVPPEYYTIQNRQKNRDKDYHIFTWEERGFDLDDIIATEDTVITGVQFKKVDSRIRLEVRLTPFNFTTGRLNKQFSFMTYNSSHKQEFPLITTDVSTHAPKSSNCTTNKYVKFTNTDYEKDAGQTTVPFFDAQPVTSKIPVPLSGVGIFHKGTDGFGGFIAPRIFTYNFTKHL